MTDCNALDRFIFVFSQTLRLIIIILSHTNINKVVQKNNNYIIESDAEKICENTILKTNA